MTLPEETIEQTAQREASELKFAEDSVLQSVKHSIGTIFHFPDWQDLPDWKNTDRLGNPNDLDNVNYHPAITEGMRWLIDKIDEYGETVTDKFVSETLADYIELVGPYIEALPIHLNTTKALKNTYSRIEKIYIKASYENAYSQNNAVNDPKIIEA